MKLRIPFFLLVLVAAALPAAGQRPNSERNIGDRLNPPPKEAASPISALTTKEVARIKVVVAAEISPDGTKIAVLTAVPRTAAEANGRSHSELSLIPFEGGPPRILVPPPGTISGIQWSGDSANVLFLSKRGDDKEARVWSVSAQGGFLTPLTPEGLNVKAFTRSPDEKRIALSLDAPEDPVRQARKKAGFVHEVYEEEWRMTRVAELEKGSSEIRWIEIPGSAFEIGYDADGSKLAITAAPTPSVDDSYMAKRVYVADRSGAAKKAIDNPGKLGNVAISPGGAFVAAVIGADLNDPKESTLAVAELPGGGAYRAITPPDYQGHVAHCAWLDASTIVTLVHEGTEAGIMLVEAKSGESRKALEPGIGGAITRLSVSPTGRMALVASRASHPAEVYAFELKGDRSPPKRLTDSNPWLNAVALGKQEVIRWPASLDGIPIEGILIHPIAKPEKPAPLIVTVHGGPEAHDMNGWLTGYSQPGQVAAGQGYYVLVPNYRSSTGRGVAFSKLGQGDLANGEFTDILDGVKALVARGLVDKAKVGITGGSYGGYLSAWAATKHSEHFAASVVFVGVSDQVSKRLCTDIPMEDYYVHWKMWTDENVPLVWDRSPIAHIRNAKTPTLICHGKDDPRVHPSQSLELYRAMKNRGGAPVRLVWYPGEGHGNVNRTSRLDYSVRMMAWFDHFLMKGGKDLPPAEMDYGDEAQAPAPAKAPASK